MHQKAKGNTFERRTANLISLLLTDNKETHAVWRTHSSGAIGTIHKKIDKKYVGDLYRVMDKGFYPNLDKFFDEYIIECKHYDDLSFRPPFIKRFYTNILIPTYYEEAGDNKVLLVIGGGNKSPIYFIEDNFGDWDISLRINVESFVENNEKVKQSPKKEFFIYGYEEKRIEMMFNNILIKH